MRHPYADLHTVTSSHGERPDVVRITSGTATVGGLVLVRADPRRSKREPRRLRRLLGQTPYRNDLWYITPYKARKADP